MIVESLNDIEKLFDTYISTRKINPESYRKTRYISNEDFYNLINYDLNFEPYITIAKKCLMRHISIMRSPKTNRFYIGFINLGGHRATFEIRPIEKSDLLDYGYIERMFMNYGQELDWGIDLNENYEI